MKVFKAFVGREGKDGGKKFWQEVGFTLFIRDDGKVSLRDDRSGTSYPMFEQGRERKGNQSQGPMPKPGSQPEPSGLGDDEIPF